MRQLKSTLLIALAVQISLTMYATQAFSQGYYAQNTKMPGKPAKRSSFQPVEKNEKTQLLTVLKELNKTRDVYFMFSNQQLASKMVNTVTDMQQQVEVILEKILKNTGLTYKKVNAKTFVILSDKEPGKGKTGLQDVGYEEMARGLNEAAGKMLLLQDIITGKIVDKNGEAIARVSVTLKGKGTGTATDANGVFSIEAERGDILVFSSVGFEVQEVTVGTSNNYSIKLVEKNNELDEVVVTALGIQRKAKSLTYSTQKVNNAELTTVKDANVINNLNGRVSGVTINKSSSGAGGSARVILRGQKSTRENQPLYVIDGVPMSNYSPAQPTDVWGQGSGSGSGGRDGGDGISNINPDDIESISVLKGAAASSLYGSQGNNGVILITTKKEKLARLRLIFRRFSLWIKLPTSQKCNGIICREMQGWPVQAALAGGQPASLQIM